MDAELLSILGLSISTLSLDVPSAVGASKRARSNSVVFYPPRRSRQLKIKREARRQFSIVGALVLLGGFLFTQQANAAVSFAQQKASTFGSVSSSSVSFNSAKTACDLVIVGIYSERLYRYHQLLTVRPMYLPRLGRL